MKENLPRSEQLRKIQGGKYDVVVVGGGINGGQIAWALRLAGKKVALVEKGDYGGGTSGKSTKIAHGRTGYLEQAVYHLFQGLVSLNPRHLYQAYAHWRLLKEVLEERKQFLVLHADSVRPEEFYYPIYKDDRKDFWRVRAETWVYDRLAGIGQGHPHYHRVMRGKKAMEMIREIGLKEEGLKGVVTYWDARLNDKKLTQRIIREAAGFGVDAVNYARAEIPPGKEGDSYKIKVEDVRTGDRYELKAKVVVLALGPWMPGAARRRGTHMIVSPRLTNHSVIRLSSRGGALFILPLKNASLVGTTDVPTTAAPDSKEVSGEDIHYLVDEVNRNLDGKKQISLANVKGTFAGQRVPLKGMREGDPAWHIEITQEGGIFRLFGTGKLTTSRLTAQRVSERVVEYLRHQANSRSSSSPISDDVERAIQKLGDSDSSVRLYAVWVLDGSGEPMAVEPLIKLLGDSNLYVRKSAAWALDKLGASKEQMVEGYIKALGSSDFYVRQCAAEDLSHLFSTLLAKNKHDGYTIMLLFGLFLKRGQEFHEIYHRYFEARGTNGKIASFLTVPVYQKSMTAYARNLGWDGWHDGPIQVVDYGILDEAENRYKALGTRLNIPEVRIEVVEDEEYPLGFKRARLIGQKEEEFYLFGQGLDIWRRGKLLQRLTAWNQWQQRIKEAASSEHREHLFNQMPLPPFQFIGFARDGYEGIYIFPHGEILSGCLLKDSFMEEYHEEFESTRQWYESNSPDVALALELEHALEEIFKDYKEGKTSEEEFNEAFVPSLDKYGWFYWDGMLYRPASGLTILAMMTRLGLSLKEWDKANGSIKNILKKISYRRLSKLAGRDSRMAEFSAMVMSLVQAWDRKVGGGLVGVEHHPSMLLNRLKTAQKQADEMLVEDILVPPPFPADQVSLALEADVQKLLGLKHPPLDAAFSARFLPELVGLFSMDGWIPQQGQAPNPIGGPYLASEIYKALLDAKIVFNITTRERTKTVSDKDSFWRTRLNAGDMVNISIVSSPLDSVRKAPGAAPLDFDRDGSGGGELVEPRSRRPASLSAANQAESSSPVEDQAKRNDEERSSLFEELYKFFDRDTGIFEDALQRPAVNFAVIGNNQGDLFGGMEKFDVAAALPDFDVSGPQKGMDDFIAGEQGRLHIVRLKTLWEALDRMSLGLGSIYNNMASLMFLMTSLSVLPWLWQPGNEGALATMYPSWPFLSTILIFMVITSQNKHTIRAWLRQGQFDIDTTPKVRGASPLDRPGVAPLSAANQAESSSPVGNNNVVVFDSHKEVYDWLKRNQGRAVVMFDNHHDLSNGAEINDGNWLYHAIMEGLTPGVYQIYPAWNRNYRAENETDRSFAIKQKLVTNNPSDLPDGGQIGPAMITIEYDYFASANVLSDATSHPHPGLDEIDRSVEHIFKTLIDKNIRQADFSLVRARDGTVWGSYCPLACVDHIERRLEEALKKHYGISLSVPDRPWWKLGWGKPQTDWIEKAERYLSWTEGRPEEKSSDVFIYFLSASSREGGKFIEALYYLNPAALMGVLRYIVVKNGGLEEGYFAGIRNNNLRSDILEAVAPGSSSPLAEMGGERRNNRWGRGAPRNDLGYLPWEARYFSWKRQEFGEEDVRGMLAKHHWSRAAAAREIGVTVEILNVWLNDLYWALRQQQRRERHAYLAGVIREAASQSLGREEIAFSIGVSTITLSNEISKLEKDLKPSASLLSDLWQRDLENLAMLFNRIKERAGADHIVLYEELRREKQEFLDQVSGQKGLLKAPSLITVRNNILSAEGRKSGVFELFRKQFADMADEAGGELAKIVGKMGREPKDTIPVRLLLKPYGVLKADKDRPSPGRGAGRPARKEDRLAALIREFSNPAPGAARPADIEEDLKRRPRLVVEAMQRILGDNVDHWQAYPRLAPIFLDAFAVIEENPGELLEDIYVYLNVNRIISQPLLSRQVLAFKRLEAFSKIYPEEFVRQIKSWQEASEGKDVYQMLIVKRFLDGPGGKLYEHALRAVRRPATPENGPSQAPQQREEQTFPQEPPTDVYAAEAHGLMREIGDVNDAHRYREIRASLPGLVKKLVILSEKSPTARKYLTRLLGMAHNGVGTLAREIYAQGREEKKSSSPVGKTREDRREMRDDRLSSLVIRPSFREFIRALWFEDYYYWLWYKMTRRARKAREQVVFNVPEALKKAGAISDVRFSLSRSPDRNAVDRREGNGRWSMVDGQTAEVSPPVGAVVHASEQAKGSPLEQDWYRFYTNKLDPLTPNHEKYFPWFVANFMDPDKTDWQEFRQQVEADPGSPWQTVLVRVREEEGHHVVASKERGIKRADFSESVYLFQ